MNAKKFFIALLVLLGFLLASCSDEQQSPVSPTDQGSLGKLVREDFTSVEYNTGNFDPGELSYLPGGNIRLRNRIDPLRIESANAFINATNGIITYNLDANALGEGHAWGRITFTPDAYQELEVNGLWNGQITMTGESEWTLIAQFVGHIMGGSTNGMQVFWDVVVTYYDPGATVWTGNATGSVQYNE